jgi:hypothetical protein
MRRLGVRKIVTAVFNSKVGQGTDKLINSLVVLPGTIIDKTGVNKVTSKLKVDLSGKRKNKKANTSIQSKIDMANRKLVEQDARDIAAAKEFEREQREGIEAMGFSVDFNLVAATRIKEKA